MRGAEVYLDNAATTYPKPEVVYQTVDVANRTLGGNAMRGNNPMALQAAQVLHQTRATLADLLGVGAADRIVFTPSATVALNQVILGTPLPPGSSVYVSPFEHNSVLRPIEHMRARGGWQVRALPFDTFTFMLDTERLNAQFAQSPPDLLVCTQASNVFGAMPDVLVVARIARNYNPDVIIVVDGAQAAGLYPLALDSGIIDYLIFSGHKSLHGPFGIAGFVVCGNRRPHPIIFGGTGTHSELLAMPDDGPATFEVGSMNIPAIAGLGAALQWLTPERRTAIQEHGVMLLSRMESGLRGIHEVTVFAPSGQRTPVLSFVLTHMSPQEVESLLGARGFSVRAGLHCSPWAHRLAGTLGSGGTVRVSLGAFNTVAEVDQFLDTIDSICY